MIQVMLFGFGKARAWICMDSPNIVGFAMWCRMSAVWYTSDAILSLSLVFSCVGKFVCNAALQIRMVSQGFAWILGTPG